MSSEIADPFGVLGVSRTATPEELKQAYRRMVKAWHPDRYAGGSDTQRLEADRRFKLINAAYVAVGELLREKSAAQTAASETAARDRSDTRIEAIRSVVASAALRVIPNVPRHTYRRITNAVEALLIDTLAVGDRAFSRGFDAAVRDALEFVGLSDTSRREVLSVLDTAADDLQWRGKGADPATWQTLLQPLEPAMHPPVTSTSSAARPQAPAATVMQLVRPEPSLRAAQAALTVLFVVLLLPFMPLPAAARIVLLVAALAALAYVTLGVAPGR